MNRPPVAESAWEIATLFPDQGAWTEADYLALETSRLVEFAEGYVEVLPMPSEWHPTLVTISVRLVGSGGAALVGRGVFGRPRRTVIPAQAGIQSGLGSAWVPFRPRRIRRFQAQVAAMEWAVVWPALRSGRVRARLSGFPPARE